jgi:hypothetical protein
LGGEEANGALDEPRGGLVVFGVGRLGFLGHVEEGEGGEFGDGGGGRLGQGVGEARGSLGALDSGAEWGGGGEGFGAQE